MERGNGWKPTLNKDHMSNPKNTETILALVKQPRECLDFQKQWLKYAPTKDEVYFTPVYYEQTYSIWENFNQSIYNINCKQHINPCNRKTWHRPA